MQGLRSWVSFSLLVQAPPFLPFLPSEACCGIRWVALWRSAQGCAPSSFRFQHTKDPPQVFPGSLSRTWSGNRKLLTELSRCAWRALNLFLMENVHQKAPMPGAVIAIQTFGDFLGFNPHCHILCTDGCFYGDGMFRVAPLYDLKKLEKIFQHQILKMLLKKGKITKDLIAMLSNWRH